VKSTTNISFCLLIGAFLFLSSCENYFKNNYKDNTPTSGQLKVYYDEGLSLHVKNQAYTFGALYPNVQLELFSSSESEAIEALFNDSCEAIVVSRLLNEKEKKVFQSKDFFPKHSAIAKTGVALICHSSLAVSRLSYEEIVSLLSGSNVVKDSTGKELALSLLFDKKNSSVLYYLLDSVLKGQSLSSHCSSLNSSIETINYVANHPNALAFIDFAWLSDVDDSISIANASLIKILAIGAKNKPGRYEYPHQSSFKLNTYPFTRTVYIMRKTGDFTLAKGFESFVSGPKGQLVFLKQGLLPSRQGERVINVNTEPTKTN
jgi:phosphate transport system substrate-binding protein